MEEPRPLLVSAKLQGVALRTPPPTDSYVVEVALWPVAPPDTTQRPGSSSASASRIRPSSALSMKSGGASVSPNSASSKAAASQLIDVVLSAQPLSRKIVRLPPTATALDLLKQLRLFTATPGCGGAVVRGGLRTQLFAVRPALGTGAPNQSLQEAELAVAGAVDPEGQCAMLRPLRDAIAIRFPFSVAITPTLDVPFDSRTDPTGAKTQALLEALHQQRLQGGSSSSSSASPTVADDGENRYHSSASANQTTTNLVPASAAASGSPLLPKGSSVVGGPVVHNVVTEGAATTAPPFTTMMGKSLNDTTRSLGDTQPAAAAAAANGSGEVGEGDGLLSAAEVRRLRREAAAADRKRIAELEEKRRANLAAKEAAQSANSMRSEEHAKQREAERRAAEEQRNQRLAEREARLQSREKQLFSDKSALLLQRQQVTEAKKDAHAARMAQIHEQLFSQQQQSDAAPAAFPYVRPVESFALHRSLSLFAAPSFSGEDDFRQQGSVTDLPELVETEAVRLERENAKSSFINRVAASRKMTERRLSRFAMVKQHPFETNATLKTLLENLDHATAEEAQQIEAQQARDRELKWQAEAKLFHESVVQHNNDKRATLKLERKQMEVERHVAAIAFERVSKEDAARAKAEKDAEAAGRMREFYAKKKELEDRADQLALQQKAMEQYVERQRDALFQSSSTLVDDS